MIRRWRHLSLKGSKRRCSLAATANLQHLGQSGDHSWLQQLAPDPDAEANFPNKRCREVFSGHYVPVLPTPLRDPVLVIHSPAVAEMLGISEEEVASEDFAAFFSGDQSRATPLKSWCTPYALAIMGRRMNSNCPFGTGNGYGDGRAISVGEVVVKGQRWEMQLKGAGTTPFCRRFDGRAVLRSSIREFLASEAMHNLGVETTRALCLVLSRSESVQRQWYAGSFEPVIYEPCAITTRVATSFLRVGHIDLFARRASRSEEDLTELRQIVEHALFREYPDVAPGQPLPDRAVAMLEAAAERIGALVSGWLRVGFCQGNFNSDNCLVGGRTMDYGPFGWIEKYEPTFAKWTGSGEHYAFMNQPGAAVANYHTLVTSVAPLLGEGAQQQLVDVLQRGAGKIRAAANDTFRVKMGFTLPGDEASASLWQELEPLMRESGIDYTIFWRQLAAVAEEVGPSDESLLSPIRLAFYGDISAGLSARWVSWLRRWLGALEANGDAGEALPARLRAVNPKYVPREWMLAHAYSEASHGNTGPLHRLHALFLRPYDEQPQSEEEYFRRAPAEALTEAGIAYMS